MTWEVDDGIDVTSAFRGVTIPVKELYEDIHRRGWQVTKVKWKSDAYEAEAKGPTGEKRKAKGPDEATALASLLMQLMRRDFMRAKVQQKVGMWQTQFTGQLEEIAKAYANAPVYEPKAASAWLELAQDSMRRAQILQTQLKVEPTDNPEPYESAQEMCEDIHKNKRFQVSRAHTEHPVWSVDQSIAFRIVHDVLGHCVSGGDFGWAGENMACAAHFPLLSENAQQALFTECIGQTAYSAYFRSFGPQKVAFLNDYMEPAQSVENTPAHSGVHPSQSVLPTETPTVPPSPAVSPNDPGYVAPHLEGLGLTPVLTRKTAGALVDPNAGWQSQIEPPPDNAFLAHGDPLDAHEEGGMLDTASRIDTNWHGQSEGEGKQAIVNAFRVVLLSPRKNLKWNAIHYQDISALPADVGDPKRYWDALERRREAWNQARGYEPGSHKIWWKPLQDFYGYVRGLHPEMDDAEVKNTADREFMEMWNEKEEQLHLEDSQKPQEKQLSSDELERKVAKLMAKWLTAVTRPAISDATDVEHPQLFESNVFTAAGEQYDMFTGEPADKYGAWMGSHLKAIAQISRYADVLYRAAVEDVHHHDASGHHFRATALSLDIPGVGPKVCSFAWLLLQPLTSQLATIDAHMMDVLGHDYSQMSDRDYFKYERQLQAGRDAAGYGHIPLGTFQWGMWDHKRTGPGSHQDHSAMRVLDPVPHQYIDWAAKAPVTQGIPWADKAPDWWQKTLPYRDAVGDDWDANVAPEHALSQIPFRETTVLPAVRASSWKEASSNAIPYFVRDGQTFEGAPGQSLMDHLKDQHGGKSTEDIWKLQYELGKRLGSGDTSPLSM